TMGRVWLPVLDALVSQLGQDGWNKPARVMEAMASNPVALSHLGQTERLPRDSEAARFMSALARLGQLTNYDPNDIVADLGPATRDRAIQLAARVASWLADLEDARETGPGGKVKNCKAEGARNAAGITR